VGSANILGELSLKESKKKEGKKKKKKKKGEKNCWLGLRGVGVIKRQ
jgi:hypothetical protein